MKVCSRCREPKRDVEFTKNKHSADRLSPWCRACASREAKKYRAANRRILNERRRIARIGKSEALSTKTRAHRRKEPWIYLRYEAKKRAKRAGVPFDITPDDVRLVWPADNRCPVLGVELVIGGNNDVSPSLDRIRPADGYVRGNIAVISMRANAIKQRETSPEAIRRVADWYEGQLAKRSL